MSIADIIIIGSGMGGSTLAAALAPTGKRILILERGEKLQATQTDRDPEAIFARGYYRSKEEWLDGENQPFNPGNYYYVGGNSKFYGAVLLRYREQDFSPIKHLGGSTLGWPMSYSELEPYYQAAETLYAVRGTLGEDPTEPKHSGSYPYPPVPDETAIARFRQRLKSLGLQPSTLPLGVDLDRWLAHGQTTWDAFPDTCGGKMDAETVGLATALKHKNVSLRTGIRVKRLRSNANGLITAIEAETAKGEPELFEAALIVLATGAVQTAALLLASADSKHPTGLANSSDQVGRNFMNHNCSAVLAIHPWERNEAIYQKTLQLNDFYHTGGPNGKPLGNIQMLGKITGPILAANSPLLKPFSNWIARHSLDLYAMSEDLPNPDSRVTLQQGRIKLDWKRSNWEAHLALVAKLKTLLRKAGYPLILSRPFDRRTPSHQCGTARMGMNPATSVVNIYGRCHQHSNLFITDASVLPTSAAVNPALTIAALALHTAKHITEQDFKA